MKVMLEPEARNGAGQPQDVATACGANRWWIYELVKVGEVSADTPLRAVQAHTGADAGEVTLYRMPGPDGAHRAHRLTLASTGDSYDTATGQGTLLVVTDRPYHLVA